ncbi:DUF4158 domain-containing protein [Nonomuraea zeae]|uniref:DUF4158 domain-containing protein n=1 Tax=Nonomuraea zeae TaxID=1642303 RepID=A0A5S4G070_9ACTN|nr:DUF4158 domain-containing protein [Nonomuraea zeae]TMR17731.1 DUF4158 domain-containing protein [Nonomuraea zeae]
MPVDFLSGSEAAKYGRYDAPPSRAEMEKIFFLDNVDVALIKGHRGRHIRYGFALQLVTVRYLGCFLADPLKVPNEVLDVVAAQLGIEDPSCVKRYTERNKTRLEHTWEIAKACGLKDFARLSGDTLMCTAAIFFQRPQLGDGRRALRDPDADDADDED